MENSDSSPVSPESPHSLTAKTMVQIWTCGCTHNLPTQKSGFNVNINTEIGCNHTRQWQDQMCLLHIQNGNANQSLQLAHHTYIIHFKQTTEPQARTAADELVCHVSVQGQH